MSKDILNAVDLLEGGSHELLGDFFRDFLPGKIYEKVLTGQVLAHDIAVANALNEVFLSFYMPACSAINAGQYAPTHDIEYELRVRAYDLCGMGLIPEWFLDKALEIGGLFCSGGGLSYE